MHLHDITGSHPTGDRPALEGEATTPTKIEITPEMIEAGAGALHCDACPMKPRCCPKTPARKVPRSIHEGAREMARDIARSEEGRNSRRLRKKVEMLFAHRDYRKFRVRAMTMRLEETSHGTTQATDDSRRHS
jgi:hypothetical protein